MLDARKRVLGDRARIRTNIDRTLTPSDRQYPRPRAGRPGLSDNWAVVARSVLPCSCTPVPWLVLPLETACGTSARRDRRQKKRRVILFAFLRQTNKIGALQYSVRFAEPKSQTVVAAHHRLKAGNQDQADNRLRPLALRRFSIRRPCLVDILFLKPWVLARRIRLG